MDIDRLSEGVDYEFVPAPNDDQAWQVRMLTGPFPETVIMFDKLSVDGKEEQINFNFTIVESPAEDLTVDDVNLQQAVGSVLFYILEDSLSNNTAEIQESK